MSRVRFRSHGDCSHPYLGADRLHSLTREARTRWGVNREGDVAVQVRQAHADDAPHPPCKVLTCYLLVLIKREKFVRRFQFGVSHEHHDWPKPPTTNDAKINESLCVALVL